MSDELQKIANAVRVLSADAVEHAGSGHAGMPLGCAEIGAYLFAEEMNYNPDQPEWFNRDRLVLSAGHGSIWLYSLLHLSGYNLNLEDLKEYRKFASKTPGHPEYGKTEGVEMTTGPLGQGIAHAVGMAAAEKILAEKYNKKEYNLIDHYTYVVAGDGDLMEGVSYESASLAGSLGLEKLIVIYDHNQVSIDGPTSITFLDNIEKRFESANWQVISSVDGNEFLDLKYAFKKAKENKDKPSIIIADTEIAKGIAAKEGKSSAHASPMGRKEIDKMKKQFDFPLEEFKVPTEIYNYFREYKDKLKQNYDSWKQLEKEYQQKYSSNYNEIQQGINLDTELNFDASKIDFTEKQPLRNYSGDYYRYLGKKLPYLVGGTADLSASTRINLDQYSDIQKDNLKGRNIKFGVREHAMAAAAGGIMLHKGLRPVTATYLTFSDYMKPAIRMAALMELPLIYVFTHDSIYVGEDGPTHQPVEQLEALRMVPGLRVIRPANGREVKLAWQAAIKEREKPSALVMARQEAESYDKKIKEEEFNRGAFIVSEEKGAEIALIASGTEVETALKVKELLKNEYKIRVISAPEKEKLYYDKKYRDQLFRGVKFKAAVEAGVPSAWYRILKGNCMVFGVEDFGYSADGDKIAAEFGLTPKKIAEKIKEELNLISF